MAESLPLASEPAAPPGGRPLGAGRAYAWLVIWCLVVTIAAFTVQSQLQRAAEPAAGVAIDVQAEAQGRYLYAVAGSDAFDPELRERVLRQGVAGLKARGGEVALGGIILESVMDWGAAPATPFVGFEDDVDPDLLATVRAHLGLPYEESRERLADGVLRSRLGWFGRLLLDHDLPPEDPARIALERQAERTLTLARGIEFAGLALMLCGSIALIWFWRSWRHGRLRPAHRPEFDRDGAWIGAFAWYMALFFGFRIVVEGTGLSPLHMMPFFLLLVPVPILWIRLQGRGWREIRAGLGLHRGAGLGRELAAGALAWLAAVPVLGLLFLLVTLLGQAEAGHPIVGEMNRFPWLTLFLAVVFAPVVEELFFRGALFHHLRSRHGLWASVLLSAIIFALMHPHGSIAWIIPGAIGAVLALIREWRGSLLASITAHMLNNGVVMAATWLSFS